MAEAALGRERTDLPRRQSGPGASSSCAGSLTHPWTLWLAFALPGSGAELFVLKERAQEFHLQMSYLGLLSIWG